MYEISELEIMLDGAKLRCLREDRGFTQETLAELVGISREHLSHLECGKSNNVFLKLAVRLSMALDVDVNDLIKTTYKKAQ